MRVVILHRGYGDAWRYRCVHLQEQLALAALRASVQEFHDGEALSIPECDLLVLHRIPLDRFLERQFKQLRDRGTIVLFETDDLVFDVKEALGFAISIGEGWLRRAFYREDLKGFIRTLRLADGALVSTEYLAQRIAATGKPAWVHANAFSSEMLRLADGAFRERRSETGRVVIGYASGTPTHERDFAQVMPALREVLERHANVELRLVGHIDPGAEWGRGAARVVKQPFVPWRQLPSVLAEFDLNLAPLEAGQPFCEAKSEIKFVEAGLVRVPTLASATGAFAGAIRDGANGFLAREREDWLTKLEMLVTNPERRKAAGLAAYEDVVTRYHPRVRAAQLIVTIGMILQDLRGRALDVRVARLALEGAGVTQLGGADLEEPDVVPARPRSHLSRAWYSLRYDSPRLFLLRLIGFAALRLKRRRQEDDRHVVEEGASR